MVRRAELGVSAANGSVISTLRARPSPRAARARSSGGAATARASVDFPSTLPMIASLSGMAARPLADIGGEANQISVGVLDEELVHTSFHVSGAIPLLLRLHEQWPASAGERRQDRFDGQHPDLKIHPAPERIFHGSRLPISGSGALIQHNLSPAEIKVRETFIGAVEEHREAA